MKRTISIILGAGILSAVAGASKDRSRSRGVRRNEEIRESIREGVRGQSRDGKGEERRENSRNKHIATFRNDFNERYDNRVHYHDWSQRKADEKDRDDDHLDWDKCNGEHYEVHANRDNNRAERGNSLKNRDHSRNGKKIRRDNSPKSRDNSNNRRKEGEHKHGRKHRKPSVEVKKGASKTVDVSTSKKVEVDASESVDKTRRNLRNSSRSGSIKKSRAYNSEVDKEIDIYAKDVTRGNERNHHAAQQGEQRGEFDLVQQGAKEGGVVFHECHANNNGEKDGEITFEEVEVKEQNNSIKHKLHGEKHDNKKWSKTCTNKKTFKENYGNGKRVKQVKGRGKHFDKLDMKRSQGGKQARHRGNEEKSFVKVNRKQTEIEEDTKKAHSDNFNANHNQSRSKLNENEFHADKNLSIEKERSANLHTEKAVSAKVETN